MKYKVLWIEDGAFVEVADFAGPVLATMKYDLQVAISVTEALKKLVEIKVPGFDVIIVDIRLPPGMAPEWEDIYNKSIEKKYGARLGIELLFSVLNHEKASNKLEKIPSWISPVKFGVFTVESKEELKGELEELNIKCFQQKKTGLPKTALLELIEKVIDNSKKNSNPE